jgi:hypothetical protein
MVTATDKKNAQVFDLEDVTPAQHQAFEHLFDSNLKRGIKYSIWDLVRYAVNSPSRDEQHTFCSRYVLNCCHAILEDAKMPLVRLPNYDWCSPRDLFISPKLVPASW